MSIWLQCDYHVVTSTDTRTTTWVDPRLSSQNQGIYTCVPVYVSGCTPVCTCVSGCTRNYYIHCSTVLQGSPTDAGLQGVINHPDIGESWLNLAIALGVPEAYIDTSSRPLGLSTFQHWRNGKVERSETTWEFLLKKVTETFGPNITEKLQKDISSHPHWTE